MGRFIVFEVEDSPSSWFGLGAMIFIVILVVYLFYEGTSYLDRTTLNVYFQMQVPAEVNGEEIDVRTVRMDDDGEIKTKVKHLDEDGNGRLMIGSKPHQLYVEYDGISYLLTTVQVDGTEEFVSACTYQGLVDVAFRPVLVQIRDVDGQTISGLPLQVTDSEGNAQAGLSMGEDGYVVILENEATGSMELTFQLEGYEPLTTQLDVQQRVTMLKLTLLPE